MTERNVRTSRFRARRVLVACVAVLGCLVVTACGGSSKPAYCAQRSNLEKSIKGLTELNASSGVSGLKAQLTKIESDATALVNSAKGDFPIETSAIKSSVDSLSTTVKNLPSSPSAHDIANVARQAASTVTAVQTFYHSTSSKCS